MMIGNQNKLRLAFYSPTAAAMLILNPSLRWNSAVLVFLEAGPRRDGMRHSEILVLKYMVSIR